jgi:hypothetical protein
VKKGKGMMGKGMMEKWKKERWKNGYSSAARLKYQDSRYGLI